LGDKDEVSAPPRAGVARFIAALVRVACSTMKDGGEAPRVGQTVDVEDVDEVIELAAKAASASADKLSVKELVEVGGELGIPAAAVERAVTELEARRRAETEAKEAARAKAQKRTRATLLGGGAALALVTLLGLVGQHSLRTDLAEVEQKRAQVRNVLDRQAHVEERLRTSAAPTSEQEAERAGAENRVAIERRRYDEAAAAYNASAAGLPGSLWASLFGLPKRAPLSNELTSW
jgi:LemA protein